MGLLMFVVGMRSVGASERCYRIVDGVRPARHIKDQLPPIATLPSNRANTQFCGLNLLL